MPQIASPFIFNSKEPNFERDRYATLEAMRSVDDRNIDEGHIAYCLEDGNVYKFCGPIHEGNPHGVNFDERLGYWRLQNSFGIWKDGSEPTDTNMLWITDTRTDSEVYAGSDYIRDLQIQVGQLQTQVSNLMKILNYGVIAGDASVGGRTEMMSKAEPIDPSVEPNPTSNYSGEDIAPAELLYTVPNLSIKIDTMENFKKHSNNLINGELVWIESEKIAEEDPGLYIYTYRRGFTPAANGGVGPSPTTHSYYVDNSGILHIESSSIYIDSDGIIYFDENIVDENGIMNLITG